MPIGTKIIVALTAAADGTFDAIESIHFKKFTHEGGFTTTSTVRKADITNSLADRYVVSTNWANGDSAMPSFATSQSSPPNNTSSAILSDAITKINAAFPGTFV